MPQIKEGSQIYMKILTPEGSLVVKTLLWAGVGYLFLGGLGAAIPMLIGLCIYAQKRNKM